MNSPFKFLNAYTQEDESVFFGRQEEIDLLYEMVYQSPMVLIYGYSGTGKTSIVKCGLASKFDSTDWYPIYIRREDNINDALVDSLTSVISGLPKSTTILEYCNALYTKYFRPIYLIFDQFEEVFILGDKAEQEQLIRTFDALMEVDLPIKIIIILREEYLGSLYQFEQEIPFIFDYKLRVEQMNLERVKTVVTKSFAAFNIKVNEPEKENINQILANVSQGETGIKLPYLQVYLDELYEEDFARTYPNKVREAGAFPEIVLTPQEIDDFGEIESVLERFLLKQEIAISKMLLPKHPEFTSKHVREIISSFITDAGTKRPIGYQRKNGLINPSVDYLEDLPSVNLAEFSDCLHALEQSRIVRLTDDTIELAHDSLAAIIHRLRDHGLLELREVKHQLKIHYATHLKAGSYLTKKKLTYYEKYLPLLDLTDEIKEFIKKSKDRIRRKKLFQFFGAFSTALLATLLFLWAWGRITTLKEAHAAMEGAYNQIQNLFNVAQDNLASGNELQEKAADIVQLGYHNPAQAYLEADSLKKQREKNNDVDSSNLVILDNFMNDHKSKQHLYPKTVLDISRDKTILKTKTYRLNDSLNYIALAYVDEPIVEIQQISKDFTLTLDTVYSSQRPISDFIIAHKNGVPLLISTTERGDIQAWDMLNKKLLYTRELNTTIFCIVASQDANVFFLGTADGIIRIHLNPNTIGYRSLKTYKGAVKQLVSIPVNHQLAILSKDQNSVDLFNLKTNEKNSLSIPNASILAMAADKKGEQLAVVYDNGKIGLWNPITKQKIRTLHHHTLAQTVAFLPNNGLLLTGDLENNGLIWNKNGTIRQTLMGHLSPIQHLDFFDDAYVVTTAQRNIKVWNIRSLATDTFRFASAITAVDFLPDTANQKIIIAEAGKTGAFHLLDVQTGHKKLITQQLNAHEQPGFIRTLMFDNEQAILLGSSNYLTSIISLSDSSQIHFRPHASDLPAVPVSVLAASNEVVAIGQGNKIIIRTKKRPNDWQKPLVHSAKVTSLHFVDTLLVAGYDNGQLINWHLKTSMPIDTAHEHRKAITSISSFIKNNQSYLVTGSKDNTAIVWQQNDQQQYGLSQRLIGHLDELTAVDYAPTKHLLLTASKDQTVKLWTWENEQLIPLKSPIRHLEPITTAQFSPDGEWVVTGGLDGMVRVWGVE